jgi:hypothetical protein
MYVSPLPVALMNAAERAGYRAAIQFFRAEAERMNRAAHLIGDAPATAAPADALQQRQKNQILELCAKGVHLIADRAEAQLQPLLH